VNNLGIKAFIIFVEILFFAIPMGLLLLLFHARAKAGSGLYLVLKTFMLTTYATLLSLTVYQLGNMIGYSGLALWVSVSISVLLGVEIAYWQLTKMRQGGSEIAKKILDA
tara:strand:+ start:5357 stop:5686 length:330 start_codon:yes stop_codon:yes gene_type:complete